MNFPITLNINILPSLLIPLISGGILLTGTVLFLYVLLHERSKLYESLFILGVLSFLFVIFEFHIVLIGGLLGKFPAAVQFHRIEQLMGAWFIAALPNFIRHLLKHEEKDFRVLKWTACAGIGAAVVLTAAAFIAPDLFVSVTLRPPDWQEFGGDWGRGKTGIFYSARDMLLAVSILISLTFLSLETLRRKDNRMLIPILAGLLIAVFFSLDDILHIYTGKHIGFFPNVPYPRFPVGITIFVGISVLAVLHRFLDQAEEINKAYKALHESEERLKVIAYNDVLTGLLNRKSFYEICNKVILQAKRSPREGIRALFFIDLDHFKDVNDSLGHNIGDALLLAAAERIAEVTRGSDYVFRLGGDEFTVLSTVMAEEMDAAIIAEKLIKSLSRPYAVKDRHVFLGASVGIALYPRDGEDVHSLVRKADSALYEAKRDRNAYRFYTLEMQNNAARRMNLLSELRDAIKDMDLHFQPQVDSAGRVVGSEALLRWNSPSLGNVSPAVFIPLAEETGLILPIGNWVIERACEYISSWKKQGIPLLPVSINISPKQLKEDTLIPYLNECMGKHQVGVEELHLEITESSFIEDPVRTMNRITRLAEEGFSISIDDFGTGYSSLSYLKNLPVKTVKIDRSFIIGVPHNDRDTSLLKAIIHMIHGLRLRALAEGVDSDEQRVFLLENSCGFIQGFYYSEPLPEAAFLEYLAENR